MSTPFHLEGKTILITGATSGIGSNAAVRITEMGGHVVLSSRNEAGLNEVAAKCRKDCAQIIAADILTQTGRDHLAQNVPHLDGLVNCVGTVHPFPVRFLDQQKLDQTMNVNFEAPVLMTSALLKAKKVKTH